jgi:D-alanyl-lipoteichoic acid acyltransferase DltB (MBOAT superfamily)
MSLSTWLRDYLYISLGGNRMPTVWGVYRNLILTMVLGGLWHGAAWHFVLWGFLHGLWLSLERFFTRAASTRNRITFTTTARIILVFHGVTALWMVFRANSLEALWNMIGVMGSFVPSQFTLGAALAIGVMVWAWGAQIVTERLDIRKRFLVMPVAVKVVPYLAAIAFVLIFGSETPKSFIYFKF